MFLQYFLPKFFEEATFWKTEQKKLLSSKANLTIMFSRLAYAYILVLFTPHHFYREILFGRVYESTKRSGNPQRFIAQET